MKILDRIITTEDFIIPGIGKILGGTIGTIRQAIGKTTIIVQIDYIEGKQKLISIPLNYLRKATPEDLDTINTLNDCIKITNSLFHPGNKYITVEGQIFTITGIKLAINEIYDLFQIDVMDELVDRNFIDTASHIPYETEEETNFISLTLEEETIKRKIEKAFVEIEEEILLDNQSKTGSDIKIIIDTIEFNIRDNNINLGIITKDKLEVYTNALIKLKNLLN